MTWSDEILADTPTGWWPCDEGTGTPQDASGNAHHATLDAGANTWVVDGTRGDVITLGAGRWSTTADIGSGGAYTLTFLAKITYNSADTGVVNVNAVGTSDDSASLVLIGDDAGNTWDVSSIAITDTDFGGPAEPLTQGDAESWQIYAFVVDGVDLALYVNGVEVGTGTIDAAIDEVLTIAFGSYDALYTPPDDGGLCAGIAAYDTALSPARIAAHYAAFDSEGPQTVDVAVNTVTVTTPTARVGVATAPVRTAEWPTGADNAPGWVTDYGEPISIDKPLNSYERAIVRVPDSEAQPAHLAEIEISRNGHRHFMGRARNIDDDSGNGHIDHSCFGTWHLFTQRYAGTAQRTNYLDNGHFEDDAGASDLSGWSAVNATPSAESTVVLSGKQAVRLTWAGPDTDPAHYDSAFAKETSPYGSRFYVAAWCFIPGTFTPGYRTFGLRCRYDTGTMQGDVATFIDATHPTNQWTRHYLELPLPPSVTAIVVCELWAPIGSIVWDHVQVVGNTADGAPTPEGSDQCLIAGEFVRAAQFGPGKADLGVARDTPVSGINSTEMMIHYQHEQVAEKVETMGTREEGFDWHVDTSSGSPVFRTYFPRRGSDKGTITFPGDVLQYRRTVTGTEAASSIITTGDANDPAREEGAAWDDAALDGLRLEAVRPIPQGSSIGLLGPKAQEYLRQSIEAPEAVDVLMTADDGEGYDPGDVVTFTATRGSAGFTEDYRVVNWHADCPNDTVTLSLVRWIDPDEV